MTTIPDRHMRHAVEFNNFDGYQTLPKRLINRKKSKKTKAVSDEL